MALWLLVAVQLLRELVVVHGLRIPTLGTHYDGNKIGMTWQSGCSSCGPYFHVEVVEMDEHCDLDWYLEIAGKQYEVTSRAPEIPQQIIEEYKNAVKTTIVNHLSGQH